MKNRDDDIKDKHWNGDGRLMKIGEVSRRSGLGIEALRFYEKSGLLDRPARTGSGYRLYDEQVLERIGFIKRAQLLGFSLDEIERLISHKRNGESPCDEVRQIVEARLGELEDRIRQMVLYRKELISTLKQWEAVGHAEGHVCGLIENSRIRHAEGRKTRKGKEK